MKLSDIKKRLLELLNFTVTNLYWNFICLLCFSALQVIFRRQCAGPWLGRYPFEMQTCRNDFTTKTYFIIVLMYYNCVMLSTRCTFTVSRLSALPLSWSLARLSDKIIQRVFFLFVLVLCFILSLLCWLWKVTNASEVCVLCFLITLLSANLNGDPILCSDGLTLTFKEHFSSHFKMLLLDIYIIETINFKISLHNRRDVINFVGTRRHLDESPISLLHLVYWTRAVLSFCNVRNWILRGKVKQSYILFSFG